MIMPEQPASIDGIQPAASLSAAPTRAPVSHDTEGSPAVKKWKRILLLFGSVFYVLYVLWCLILIMILPAPGDAMKMLVLVGAGSAVLAGLVFIGMSVVVLMHISQTKATTKARKFALIKLLAVVIPGLILSVVTPLMIMREPALFIEITNPRSSDEMVAPVSITFDLTSAIDILSQRGFRPIQYKWDLNADRKVDQETLDPVLTANFEREGIYTVSVAMIASDGSSRSAARRFVIRQAVFSVTPTPPIIDKPAVFSLAHLYPDPDVVLSVDWDFDSDGKADDTTTEPQTSYTFFKTGRVTVSALVQLANKTQARYERVIDVQEPAALPFPVKLVSEPNNLIGSAPFSALFTIETAEPLAQVQWTFGDGEKADGPRAAHTYGRNGNFPVQARIRSESGAVVNLSTVVKIVDRLDLPDLVFEGSPKVNGSKIEGEVPLTLNLKPVTKKQFIDFYWEAPGATDVGSTDETLQAIYRREGTYVVTLIAQDLEDHVLRLPITVTVLPPSSLLSISMDPTAGVAPLTVRFDASESSIPGEDITGFIWGFGDTSAKEFGGASTEHTYTRAGTYVVDLTVRSTSGKQFSTTKTLVVREPLLQACILPSRTRGPAPLGVNFDAEECSSGIFASYLWDFGDGVQSDEMKPLHVFSEPGVYTVKLRGADASGTTSTTSVIITAE